MIILPITECIWFGHFHILIFFSFINICSTLSYKAHGFFWQLTDIHWDFNYNEGGIESEMCHRKNETLSKQYNGYYGSYFCDAPWSLVQSTLQAMKDFHDNPDFILWTGDNAPHTGNMAQFPIIFQTFRNLTSEIKLIFGPNIPLIPILGNHDTYPKDEYPDSDLAFYNRYLDDGNLKDLISIESWGNFRQGGYYRHKLNPHLSILVLNTNLYYSMNSKGKGTDDPGGQFKWMRGQFKEIQENGGKVFVAAHAPPGYWERSPVIPFYNATYNDVYIDILNEFSDLIIAQLYGHLHTDSFRIFATSNDILKSAAFIAPSVTPLYPTRLPGGTGINPSIRLFSYNSTTVLNYIQYNMNLTEANNFTNASETCSGTLPECSDKGQSPWREYYQATSLFGVPALGVKDLALAFINLFTNDSLFQMYYSMNSAGFDQRYCNITCKKKYLCSISHLKIDSVYKCLNASKSLTFDFTVNLTLNHMGLLQQHQNGAESLPRLSVLMMVVVATSSVILLVAVALIAVVSNRCKREVYAPIEWTNRNLGYSPLRIVED